MLINCLAVVKPAAANQTGVRIWLDVSLIPRWRSKQASAVRLAGFSPDWIKQSEVLARPQESRYLGNLALVAYWAISSILILPTTLPGTPERWKVFRSFSLRGGSKAKYFEPIYLRVGKQFQNLTELLQYSSSLSNSRNRTYLLTASPIWPFPNALPAGS